MKTFAIPLRILSGLMMLLMATSLLAEELTTLSGVKYSAITVTRIDPDGISISHETGVTKIPFTDLPESFRMKYTPQPNSTADSPDPATSKAAKSGVLMIGGFLNVPWGVSREKAKEIISQREGVIFDIIQSTDKTIFFTGGTFSNFRIHLIGLRFVDNQFYSGFVTVRGPTLKSTWNDLMTGLTRKYGPGEAAPSKLFGLWKFPDDIKKLETISVLGSARNDDVVVQYENNALSEKAIKAHKKEIQTGDF